MSYTRKSMKAGERKKLIETLRARFETNMQRHRGVEWSEVEARLDARPRALDSLWPMETSGGEPDVVRTDAKEKDVVFIDCSRESPAGRRSLCYDPESLAARKENRPAGSAVGRAQEMGIELLTEEQYRQLQSVGEFDVKTSSWIATPGDLRALGGALFCDRRYGRVFVYHNGAQSYYASRAFRGRLRI